MSHPVAVVFPYLADPLRWHEFAPACVYREQIDDGPPEVGTRWRATDRIGPFRAHFIDRLDALDHGRRAVWLSSDPWNSRVEYACEEAGSVTRIHADYVGELGGALRWQTGWLPDSATHAILARDFVRLQRVLDRRADESQRWRRRHAEGEHASLPG